MSIQNYWMKDTKQSATPTHLNETQKHINVKLKVTFVKIMENKDFEYYIYVEPFLELI